MKKKVVPLSGIDTDARLDSVIQKLGIWIQTAYGSNTGSITVPLSADFTTANIPDYQMFVLRCNN